MGDAATLVDVKDEDLEVRLWHRWGFGSELDEGWVDTLEEGPWHHVVSDALWEDV